MSKTFYFEILKFSLNYLNFGNTTSINRIRECVSELACGTIPPVGGVFGEMSDL